MERNTESIMKERESITKASMNYMENSKKVNLNIQKKLKKEREYAFLFLKEKKDLAEGKDLVVSPDQKEKKEREEVKDQNDQEDIHES